MKPLSRIANRSARSLAATLGLSAVLLGLSAAPAVAAPSLSVELTRDTAIMPVVHRNDQRVDYTLKVTNVSATDPTAGMVTAELELPGGLGTYAYQVVDPNQILFPPIGWSCSSTKAVGAQPAKVTCTQTDELAPGASFASIRVQTALGQDAPNTAIATATVSGGGMSSPVSSALQFDFAPPVPFAVEGYEAFVHDELGNEYTQAGGHPHFAEADFRFSTRRWLPGENKATFIAAGNVKTVLIDAARGFVGNALSVSNLCPTTEAVREGKCPTESIVGGIDLYFPGNEIFNVPVFSVVPEFGRPAQFAFYVSVADGIYVFYPVLRPDEGYAISLESAPIVTFLPLARIDGTLCGNGARTSGVGISKRFATCRTDDDPDANPVPLVTNPTRCAGTPPTSSVRANSWEHPENFPSKEFVLGQPTGCPAVPFDPEAELKPTNTQADSPTGLSVEIEMPTDGLLDPDGVAQANLDNATVTFPEGMTINAAAAEGLGSCTQAQIKMGSNDEDECPESSKVGTVEIDTPLIRKTLTGDVYVAKQNDNPLDAPIGLYMAFQSERDGVRVKVAGKLTPDPVTGQLVSTFVENPEWPFSRLSLNFNSGPRAALINPPKCGTYAIKAEFSPWSAVNPANPTVDEIVVDNSTYVVDSGPNGAPCPPGSLEPKLSAGVTNPTAGSKSPFVFRLGREDGTQRFTGLEVTTPKGLTAYLKGIPYCPDVALAGISTAEETGAAQLIDPSCPAASQVGTVLAGAGAGAFPFQAPGKVYLAGPYKGAPVSLVAVTPAVAGPYDFGNVAIRNPLYVDPVTSQVRTTSDPIPSILHGVKLNVRDVRLALDRPSFTAAPTNCEPMAVEAKVTGESGATASAQSRFQVGGCEALGFKPKLTMRLFGGTKRGAHPKFRAILTPRPGDANIAATSVALPHSEFLDQGHIRTVCTRVQFAAKECPAGSIYGEAEATTPLLDNPVKGPVYLRSSSNQLPDLVMALRGPDAQPIEVHVVGRIDSVNGGIRSTFDVVPDQPVTSFTLTMQGGKKGLLVNSRDLCAGKPARATAIFTGQNGKRATMRPKLQNACKQARKGKKNSKRANKRKRNH